MNKRKLVLIKHAMPEINPQLSAKYWMLSEEGKQACSRLAQKLSPYHFHEMISSEEIKARQTAQLTAAHLGLTTRSYPGLHEHDREGVPYFRSKTAFNQIVEVFFNHPDQLIFGNETAQAAFTRFDSAVKTVIKPCETQDDLIIVCHGTVISLFASFYNAVNGFEFWQKLDLPSMVILCLADFALLEAHFTI